MELRFIIRDEKCVALQHVIVWYRERNPLSSCISYSAALWSLLALLQCTKPFCGFPKISREGEKERRGGEKKSWWGGSPLEAPGLSPLSPQENMPAFPKTLVLRASSPRCLPPAHTGERRRGDLCHGNPISSPPELPVSPDRLWERGRVSESREGVRAADFSVDRDRHDVSLHRFSVIPECCSDFVVCALAEIRDQRPSFIWDWVGSTPMDGFEKRFVA